MTNRNSRLNGGRKAKPTPTATPQTPAMPPEPDILPSPLTPMHWITLQNILIPEMLGDAAERRRAVEALMRHAVVREKILEDLTLRLDNLLTVCEKEAHYADNLARGYCKAKLGFIVKTLMGAVMKDLAGMEPTRLHQPV